MGIAKIRNKMFVTLKDIISEFTYREFIYFIYNLGMDYYDGLDILNREEWQAIFNCLKDSYIQYEVEKKIKYKDFREIMATLIGKIFYKHKHDYEVTIEAWEVFGKGNKNAKLNYLIKDFEEHEILDNEFKMIDNKD